MKLLGRWRRPLMTAGLAAGLLLFAWQFAQSFLDARSLGWRIFAQPGAVALAFVCGLLVYAAQMIAWRLTLRYLDVDLGLPEIFEGFQLSFLPRYIPGSVWGYLSRSQWLEQVHGVSYGASLIGSLLELAVQALTAAVVGLGFLAVTAAGMWQWLSCAAAAVLLAVTWIVTPRLVLLLGRRRTGAPVFHPRAASIWGWVVVANLVLRLLYGLSFWGIILALAPAAPVGAAGAIAASNLAWLLGFVIPIVPTGIGVREWAVAELLIEPALLSAAQANLAAVMFRFVVILTELIWLGVGLALYARRWRSQAASRPSATAKAGE